MKNFFNVKDSFENLKNYIINDQYKIIDVVLYNFNDEKYKFQDKYLESKLFNKTKKFFIQSKVYDTKNNRFIEDEKLENDILFANIWYTLNLNFFNKKEKEFNVESIFDNKSFANYFKLMLTVITLKANNKYDPSGLYYILNKSDEFLAYLFEQIYYNTEIKLPNNITEPKYIRHTSNIFEQYLDDIFVIKNEKKKLK